MSFWQSITDGSRIFAAASDSKVPWGLNRFALTEHAEFSYLERINIYRAMTLNWRRIHETAPDRPSATYQRRNRPSRGHRTISRKDVAAQRAQASLRSAADSSCGRRLHVCTIRGGGNMCTTIVVVLLYYVRVLILGIAANLLSTSLFLNSWMFESIEMVFCDTGYSPLFHPSGLKHR
jgi:hypothetical protein